MSPPQEKIIAFLADKIVGLKAIYVFGSRATGHERPDSDYDIAFLADESPSKSDCFNLSQELAAQLDAEVDLVDLRRASTVFRSEILTNSRKIHSDNDVDVENFENFVFSDYARLNEERFLILNDIAKRGQIYDR